MSSLILAHSKADLDLDRLDIIVKQIKVKLVGRVTRAYVFGSASTGEIRKDSDIDLILVQENNAKPFLDRVTDFYDLFEIYPNIDLLIYSEEEFNEQLADSSIGFWKSVRESMKQIV